MQRVFFFMFFIQGESATSNDNAVERRGRVSQDELVRRWLSEIAMPPQIKVRRIFMALAGAAVSDWVKMPGVSVSAYKSHYHVKKVLTELCGLWSVRITINRYSSWDELPISSRFIVEKAR